MARPDWHRKRLKRAPLVVAACLALFAGTALAHSFLLADGRWLWPIIVLMVYSLWRHNLMTLFCLGLFFFGLGWWRGSAVMRQMEDYAVLAHHKVMVIGVAAEDGVYGDRSQMTFGLSSLQVTAPYRVSLPGQIKVAGFGVTAVYRGDIVQVDGSLYPTRGNNQAGISFASLKVLGQSNSPIDSFRRKFAAGMASALPEPLASFGLGLLVGQRNTLPKDVSDMLLVVGLTHVIAVSGYNLTILVDVARRLFGGRSKFQTTACCIFLIFTFLLITGNSPSIVRASIISVLSILAWHYGRKINPLVLLLSAAAITVLANPLYLWGNVSWYLSFLAFFGVVVLAPIVTRRLCDCKEPGLLKKIIIESLCAEAMTLPYVLYIFGQMSLVSLLSNILVVTLVPLAMLLGLIAGLAGMLVPAVAGWFAWPARMLLTYMLDTANVLSGIPHSFLEGIGFSLAMMLAVYAVTGCLALIMHLSLKGDPND
ncbi:MAG TPA: ComEC/Rec2 family competence protein [Patescibacteria group bacterium]|nr:ComEC/Rec2 family competence protein [Patescibacteria group bacterium]